MSARYLLPCPCGKSVAVGSSQAGGTVACPCGASLDVPRLRDLRELPVEEAADATKRGWSFRLGVLSAGLVIAAALAGVAGWLAATEPAPPAPFDAAARQSVVDQNLDKMAPTDLLNLLVNFYEPLVDQGFQEAKSPQDAYVEQQIETSQWRQEKLLIAAGVVLVLSIGLFAISPK